MSLTTELIKPDLSMLGTNIYVWTVVFVKYSINYVLYLDLVFGDLLFWIFGHLLSFYLLSFFAISTKDIPEAWLGREIALK